MRGIPVEEIIRVYNAKNGMVRVYCKYEGEAYFKYTSKHPEQEPMLEAQKSVIIDKLNKLGIIHGHLHNGNFTVKKENGKIVVKAIDFDMAESPN